MGVEAITHDLFGRKASIQNGFQESSCQNKMAAKAQKPMDQSPQDCGGRGFGGAIVGQQICSSDGGGYRCGGFGGDEGSGEGSGGL